MSRVGCVTYAAAISVSFSALGDQLSRRFLAPRLSIERWTLNVERWISLSDLHIIRTASVQP